MLKSQRQLRHRGPGCRTHPPQRSRSLCPNNLKRIIPQQCRQTSNLIFRLRPGRFYGNENLKTINIKIPKTSKPHNIVITK